MRKLLYLFLVLFDLSFSQLTYNRQVDLGTITEAYEIKGDVMLTNSGNEKIFLMRADADQGVKIFTSKKKLMPGDTCLLIISFIPENKGPFNKQIRLVSSDKSDPNLFTLKGALEKIKRDDKLACFYFGSRRTSPVPAREEPVFVQGPTEKRDVTNKIPDSGTAPTASKDAVKPTTEVPSREKEIKPTGSARIALPESEYKPNNIIFLVDISGSMKDSLKLPLMKSSLHHLVDAIRAVDKITFVTYADTIKTLTEAASSADRNQLHNIIDALKAKGMTKGRKAILYSQTIAQKNFIEGGNNEIIIATDGKFRFEKPDQKLWDERQADKAITLTTVAFGEDKEALHNLKDISRKGKGSFIHIKSREGSKEKLLDEIMLRSKR